MIDLKLYPLTAKIHQLLEKNFFNIYSDFSFDRYVDKENNIWSLCEVQLSGTDNMHGLFEAPQIRQILIAFEDLLLKNQITYPAEAYCREWLDGLEPLFDREPETVLTELLELLEKLINK